MICNILSRKWDVLGRPTATSRSSSTTTCLAIFSSFLHRRMLEYAGEMTSSKVESKLLFINDFQLFIGLGLLFLKVPADICR